MSSKKPTGPAKSASNYTIDPETNNVRIQPRDALLDRLPPTAGRITAFDQLHEHLAVATELFQHHGDEGRIGVYRAMGYLIEYLTARGIPHATLQPLTAVMAAIVDAERGTESPIFKPTRNVKGGAPPKAVLRIEFEGKLATIVECCVLHCKSEGKRSYLMRGTQRAALLINESAWPERVTARELQKLLERVKEQDRISPDRMVYEISMSTEAARSNPLKYARSLLSHEWVNPVEKLSLKPPMFEGIKTTSE